MRWRIAPSLQDLDYGKGVLLDVFPLDYLRSHDFQVVYREDLGDRMRYLLWNIYTGKELAVEKRKRGGMGGS